MPHSQIIIKPQKFPLPASETFNLYRDHIHTFQHTTHLEEKDIVIVGTEK